MNQKVEIWTDGACSGNPGPGGWGAILKWKNQNKEISGGEHETTNNKMELVAVIEAIKSLNKKCDVNVYTDSIYVRDGITQWIKKWKNNNWKNAQKKNVKNKELWMELDGLVQQHNVDWHWIKGHAGNPLNERADELARNAILTLAHQTNHP